MNTTIENNAWVNIHFKSGLVRRAKLLADGTYVSTWNDNWFSGYRIPEDVNYIDPVDDNIWMMYEDTWIKYNGLTFEVVINNIKTPELTKENMPVFILGLGLNSSQSDAAFEWLDRITHEN
jgi:hypothetical protein